MRKRRASIVGLADSNALNLILYRRAMLAGVSPEAITCVRAEPAVAVREVK
jgi:hypothetical protein